MIRAATTQASERTLTNERDPNVVVLLATGLAVKNGRLVFTHCGLPIQIPKGCIATQPAPKMSGCGFWLATIFKATDLFDFGWLQHMLYHRSLHPTRSTQKRKTQRRRGHGAFGRASPLCFKLDDGGSTSE